MNAPHLNIVTCVTEEAGVFLVFFNVLIICGNSGRKKEEEKKRKRPGNNPKAETKSVHLCVCWLTSVHDETAGEV